MYGEHDDVELDKWERVVFYMLVHDFYETEMM